MFKRLVFHATYFVVTILTVGMEMACVSIYIIIYNYIYILIYVASYIRSKSSTVIDWYWRGQSSNFFHYQKQLNVNHVMSLKKSSILMSFEFSTNKNNCLRPVFSPAKRGGLLFETRHTCDSEEGFGDQGAQSINGFMENWNSKTTAGYTGNFPMNQCRESDVSCQKRWFWAGQCPYHIAIRSKSFKYSPSLTQRLIQQVFGR